MQRKPSKAYFNAYSALYGDSPIQTSKKRSSRGKPNLSATEDQEQIAFVNWLDRRFIPFYHVPNGGQRNLIEGAKFKRLGVRPGVPDICIPRARKGYHGLYIELKRTQGGRLTPHQLHWQRILKNEGYKWVLALGALEAIKAIEEYLGD